MISHKVEVKEYEFENGEKIYRLVEKHYVLGIRFVKDKHRSRFYSLEEAKSVAERLDRKICKENMIGLLSSKTVYTVGED
jgi:hypothetical protein